jgi:hypothetical protein
MELELHVHNLKCWLPKDYQEALIMRQYRVLVYVELLHIIMLSWYVLVSTFRHCIRADLKVRSSRMYVCSYHAISSASHQHTNVLRLASAVSPRV